MDVPQPPQAPCRQHAHSLPHHTLRGVARHCVALTADKHFTAAAVWHPLLCPGSSGEQAVTHLGPGSA